MLMHVGHSLTTRPDASTTAWVAAVVAAGGTVSSARQALVNDLIIGLKADGVWQALDRLWIFAMENSTEALTDLVAGAAATAVSSPTFAVDAGYTGNGTTSYIDANFNASTAAQPHYTRNNACLFSWRNATGTSAKPWLNGVLAGTGTSGTSVAPMFTDNNDYFALNDTAGTSSSTPGTGVVGLYLANRTIAANCVFDRNGSFIANGVNASAAVTNANFCALRNEASFGDKQVSCFGFGGGLGTDSRVGIYNRLRTYMTAVGLP